MAPHGNVDGTALPGLHARQVRVGRHRRVDAGSTAFARDHTASAPGNPATARIAGCADAILAAFRG
jgi:hypothetical protein